MASNLLLNNWYLTFICWQTLPLSVLPAVLRWRRGQDTQEHHTCDHPHAWSQISPGHIPWSPHSSLCSLLTPRSDPDQVLWSSEQCWVTSETCSAGGTSTGGGAGACLMMRKLIRIFRLCLYDLLSILWWNHHCREERSKCDLHRVLAVFHRRRRCFVHLVYRLWLIMTLNYDLRVRRCCDVGSQVQRPESGSTTCGGVLQQQRHGLSWGFSRMTDGIHRVFCNSCRRINIMQGLHSWFIYQVSGLQDLFL